MKKKLPKITDFVSLIPWEQIELIMGKREFKKFSKWMRGQTCCWGGVFHEDLNNYLTQRARGVKDPIIYD